MRSKGAVFCAGAVVVLLGFLALGCAGTDAHAVAEEHVPTARDAGSDGATASGGGHTTGMNTSTSTATTHAPRPPANTLSLEKYRRVTGDISPKSVVASGKGLVTAQNMMYTHTVTAYDSDGELVATVPDTVTLSDFGIDKPGEYKGAPVEAAFMPDGKEVYISNYSMYGPGFSEGNDKCSPGDGTTTSYLYRINTTSWAVDQVIPAGAVPKFVAVTPDSKLVLATNWCTWDLSIADTATGKVIRTVQIGRYPRGIAITSDSATAYVAAMGTSNIAVVDIASGAVRWFNGVGQGPRQLVLSPDDRHLYATLNKAGKVARIDTATGQVLNSVATGNQPRSMDISTDGTALYVVNYESDDVTKLNTQDMSQLQVVPSGHHPIGITYDDATGRVWVANYTGSIDIWNDVPPGAAPRVTTGE